MQDNYIGDIGDYGKYGLLREVCAEALSLSVNWYKVVPKKVGKQDDGKFISYLDNPRFYREYDPTLCFCMRTSNPPLSEFVAQWYRSGARTIFVMKSF